MTKRKKTIKKIIQTSLSKKTLKRLILEIFVTNPIDQYNYKQLSKKLGIKELSTKQMITEALIELCADGRIDEVYTGKYKYVVSSSTVEGIIEFSNRNGAILKTDAFEEVVFIYPENLHHALHGDLVKVKLYAKMRKEKKIEGEVIEIIKEAKKVFVGTIELSENYGFLCPDNKNMPFDVFIPLSKTKKAKNGDKVTARIVEWPVNGRNPVGEVVQVLGEAGTHEVEINAIMAEYDLPIDFPEKVIQAAEKLTDEITEAEIAKRSDYRNVWTITIDPEDAKDFDDALSLQKLPSGNWEVGVHIADVTHYVKANTILEKEAQSRATSIYLVDRVVPMLPEKLSNFICSLRPHEEKLTFSAIFELDENADIVSERFEKTIINSNHRFSYEEAQQIIETHEGIYAEQVLVLDELAKKLRAMRFKSGAISFERVEPKIKIDEKGKPIGVYFKESKDAHKLIEEFMLLANKRVAEFIGKPQSGKKVKTYVYRVHDEPDLERLTNFSMFIKKFGYNLKLGTPKTIAGSMNELLTNVKGKNEQDIIETLAIRTMAKAHYSTNNMGHYGLAFDYYTHFTSPIRRYPDMMSHRLLELYLKGGKSAMAEAYEEKCKHSSDMEQKAMNAERASIKYKQVEYMQDKLGFIYDGIISGVTQWGLYVEIVENKVEGMVPLRDIDDDYYVFEEKNYCIVGQKTKKRYTIGDKVRIQIVKANLFKKQLDFRFYNED